MMSKRRVAEAIVERLCAHGMDRVFTVAGESYLDVLDALYDVRSQIEVVTCRHEAAAANLAEASAKLTGRPGPAEEMMPLWPSSRILILLHYFLCALWLKYWQISENS